MTLGIRLNPALDMVLEATQVPTPALIPVKVIPAVSGDLSQEVTAHRVDQEEDMVRPVQVPDQADTVCLVISCS